MAGAWLEGHDLCSHPHAERESGTFSGAIAVKDDGSAGRQRLDLVVVGREGGVLMAYYRDRQVVQKVWGSPELLA